MSAQHRVISSIVASLAGFSSGFFEAFIGGMITTPTSTSAYLHSSPLHGYYKGPNFSADKRKGNVLFIKYRWIAYINPNYYALSSVTFFILEDFDLCNGTQFECFFHSGPYHLW